MEFLSTWDAYLLKNKVTEQVYAAFKSFREATDFADNLNAKLSTKIPFYVEVVPGMEAPSKGCA